MSFDIDPSACRGRQQRLLAEIRQHGLDYVIVAKIEHVQWLVGPRFGLVYEPLAALANAYKVMPGWRFAYWSMVTTCHDVVDDICDVLTSLLVPSESFTIIIDELVPPVRMTFIESIFPVNDVFTIGMLLSGIV